MERKTAKISPILLLKHNFQKILDGENSKKTVVILGIIGILLIFISDVFKPQKVKNLTADVRSSQKIESEEYAKKLEKNLEEIVSNIKGAGKAKILVTIESDRENVYATEEKKNNEQTVDNFDGETTRQSASSDSEKRYITTRDSSGNENALKITEVQPKIRGVVILCQGGEDHKVKKKIIEAVTTALNITSKKVYVTNCA